MADEADTNDDFEIIEVDALPEGDELRKLMAGETDPAPKPGEGDGDGDGGQAAGAGGAGGDDDDDDDDEDERLADHDEDDNPRRQRRRERRRLRNEARDRTLAELAELRRFKQEAERRLAAVEGGQTAHTAQQIERGISETQRQIEQAERLLAQAIEAGNGEDAAKALKLRDEARDQHNQLTRFKANMEQQPPGGGGGGGAPADAVARHAADWRAANASWYHGPGATDAASRIANQIDAQMIQEGLDPSSQSYWTELTRRVKAEFTKGNSGDPPKRERRKDDKKVDEDDPGRRKAPPIGAERSGGAGGGRNGVVVTPERKQAMVEAGVWDDPELRKRYLKAYQDFDRNNQSAR